MLTQAAVAALNHLLGQEPWARERLRGFAGQRARLALGALTFDLCVTAEGCFAAPQDAEGTPAVTIELPGDAALRYAGDPEALFAKARIVGAADFAEAIGFVFRHVRWDFEGDLAAFVGDIPARRLAQLHRRWLAWQRSAARRLAENGSEYLTEEGRMLTSSRTLEEFCQHIDTLRDDVARLEKRLARLSPPG